MPTPKQMSAEEIVAIMEADHEPSDRIDGMKILLAMYAAHLAGRMPGNLFVCRSCGYHPGNHSDWCELGCGRDYNKMHEVPLTEVHAVLRGEIGKLSE